MRLSGIIPFGVVALLSMRHGEHHVIEHGAFGPLGELPLGDDVAAGVFLLLGYSYSEILASQASGLLSVRMTRQGIEWSTRALPKTETLSQVSRLSRARLIGGAVPGYVPLEVEKVPAFGIARARGAAEVTIVKRGMLCEINLVSRAPGDGSTVQLRR